MQVPPRRPPPSGGKYFKCTMCVKAKGRGESKHETRPWCTGRALLPKEEWDVHHAGLARYRKGMAGG